MPRVADRVGDVRHEHQVAVAGVVRGVDRGAGLRVDEVVQVLRQPFVDVHDHRVLLAGVEVLRLDEHALERQAVGVLVLDQLGLAPDELLLLRVGVADALELLEAQRRLEQVGVIVKRLGVEEQRVGELGLGRRAEEHRLERDHFRPLAAWVEDREAGVAVLQVLDVQQHRPAQVDGLFLGVELDVAVLEAGDLRVLGELRQLLVAAAFGPYLPDVVLVVQEDVVFIAAPAHDAVGRRHRRGVEVLVVEARRHVPRQVGDLAVRQ